MTVPTNSGSVPELAAAEWNRTARGGGKHAPELGEIGLGVIHHRACDEPVGGLVGFRCGKRRAVVAYLHLDPAAREPYIGGQAAHLQHLYRHEQVAPHNAAIRKIEALAWERRYALAQNGWLGCRSAGVWL